MKKVSVVILAFLLISCGDDSVSNGGNSIRKPINGAFGYIFGDKLGGAKRGGCYMVKALKPLPDYANKLKWKYKACISYIGMKIYKLEARPNDPTLSMLRKSGHCYYERDKFVKIIQDKYDGAGDRPISGWTRKFEHGDVKYYVSCSSNGMILEYTNERLEKKYEDEYREYKREKRRIKKEEKMNKINNELKDINNSAF